MAYDILFRRRTPRNWAHTASFEASPMIADIVLTEAEKGMLARIALCRAQAQGGDKRALKVWKKTNKQIVGLRRKAARGDVKAQRQVKVLQQSGLYQGVQAMDFRPTVAGRC